MVMRSEREEREYVANEAAQAVRRMRVWPCMRLEVPIHDPLMDGDDPFDAVVSMSAEEPMMLRIATVELVNLDDASSWIITLPPPAPPRGLKRALEEAEGAGSW